MVRITLQVLLLSLAGIGLLRNNCTAQPGRYTVLFPSQISAGSNSGDRDILGAIFYGNGMLAGKADSPMAVSAQIYREFTPVALPDSAGGYFLAYTIEHSDSANQGDRDILMRRVDSSGRDLWGDSTNRFVAIAQSKYIEENPRLLRLQDSSLLVFYHVRYGTGAHGDVDIAALRIGRDGNLLWVSGKWLLNSKRQELLREVIPNGSGGAIAVVEARSFRDSSLVGSDIVAQKIDSTGWIGWKEDSSAMIVAASRHLERNPVAVSDGAGGIYVAYELEYTASERAGDVDLFAQHLSWNGARQWVDEKKLPIVSSVSTARETRPAIVRDGWGIIVAFELYTSTTKDKKPLNAIGLQRLDTGGTAMWNGGKKPKLIALNGMIPKRPGLLDSPAGGAYLIFESHDTARANSDIYAQRLTSDGDQMWGNGEAPIAVFNSPENERDPVAVRDRNEGVIVVAVREQSGASPQNSYSAVVAERIAFDGIFPWAGLPSPVVLAATPNHKERPLLWLMDR